MIVKIKENFRYFESDDTDFTLTGPEEKELPEKNLRSYSIKSAIFTGKMIVVSGSMTFNFKHAFVYIDSECLYGVEFGHFFTKDLEFDTISFIDERDVPAKILQLLKSRTEFVEVAPTVEVDEPKETQNFVPEVDGKKVSKTIMQSEDSKEPDESEEDEEPKEAEEAETKPNFNVMLKDELLLYAKTHNIKINSEDVKEIRKELENS